LQVKQTVLVCWVLRKMISAKNSQEILVKMESCLFVVA